MSVRLVSFKEMKEPAYLSFHPFGQIPTYEEGDLTLFESGAIVFHIADNHAGLFAALNNRLGNTDWLDGGFSAGDLLMVAVLRRLSGSDDLEKYPNRAAYVARR